MLICGFSAYSQDCKYSRDEIDEFTKKHILETKPQQLTISNMGLGFSTAITLKKVQDSRFLVLSYTSPSNIILQRGSKIMLKDDSDFILELIVPELIISKSTYNSTLKGFVHKGDVAFALTANEFEDLKSHMINKMRVYTSEGYIDDDISEKRWKKISILLKCID